MILKTVFALLGLAVLIESKSYENFKVYGVVPNSDEQVQILIDLEKSGIEFWDDVIFADTEIKIMVAPDQDDEFVRYSKSVGLDAVLKIPDVQEMIDAQRQPSRNAERFGSFTWDRYHELHEIHAWLDELENLYPDAVSTVTIGTSLEGRPIKGVIIDFLREERDDPPLIGMIEGGIHSREWISPATVTWIIKEFVSSNDSEVRFLAEAFAWHIFPVVNPDGYVYTFSDDRMWRKNRNPSNFVQCSSNPDLGNGIDLNRNFDFLWNTQGASSDPCSQMFAGPSPTSELEAQAIQNYVFKLKEEGNFLYYFAFHSFGQMVLVPYSHSSGLDKLQVDNYADLYEIAIRGTDKLTEKHGRQYTVGTSIEILYVVTGSSFDWVKGVAEIPIVYLFELRDTNPGTYGFLLPPEQIIPNNEEIMECLLEMDRTTRILRYYSVKQEDREPRSSEEPPTSDETRSSEELPTSDETVEPPITSDETVEPPITSDETVEPPITSDETRPSEESSSSEENDGTSVLVSMVLLVINMGLVIICK